MSGETQPGAPRPSVPPPFGRIGKYTLLEPLAKGGMGQVFVAQRDGSSELCVLKQLLGDLEDHPTAPIRFYREAQISTWLAHPNIARILDAGYEGDTFCIALEYVPGRDIRSITVRLYDQQQMLPYALSIAVGLGVLRGLAHAHTATDSSGQPLSIVHRDLTPRNVLLSIGGDVKVIDFGLARGAVGDFRTAPGVVIGTFRYVAPEQAVAEGVDARADLYSLSVVLHELLTGRYIWHDGPPDEVLRKVIEETFPPVTSINTALPKEIDAVIAKGLAKRRQDRFSSASEYAEALEHAARGVPPITRDQIGRFVRAQFPEIEAEARRLVSLAKMRFLEPPEQYLETVTRAFAPMRAATGSTADLPVVPVDMVSPPADRLGLPVSPDAILDLGADPSTRTRTDVGAEVPREPRPRASSSAPRAPLRAPSTPVLVSSSRSPSISEAIRARRGSRRWQPIAIAGFAFALGLIVNESRHRNADPPPVDHEPPPPAVPERAQVAPPTDPKPEAAPESKDPNRRPEPKPKPALSLSKRPLPPPPERPAKPAQLLPEPPAAPDDRPKLARIEAEVVEILDSRDHDKLRTITKELLELANHHLTGTELSIARMRLGQAEFNADPELARAVVGTLKAKLSKPRP
ncbi:MAG: protein kinase [Deltaproteobacteria bacterium]|nr:protein kinase [Deltaproteobacteria bacterium]